MAEEVEAMVEEGETMEEGVETMIETKHKSVKTSQVRQDVGEWGEDAEEALSYKDVAQKHVVAVDQTSWF